MSGIIAVYNPCEDITDTVYRVFRAQQNRGEYGAGISIAKKESEKVSSRATFKELGVVDDLFFRQNRYHNLHSIQPNIAVGCTNYPKTLITWDDLEPIYIDEENYKLSLSFDGYLLGLDKLKERLEKEEHTFKTGSEAEILGRLFLGYLEEEKGLFEAGREFMSELYGRGGYSIVGLIGNGHETHLFGLRDPTGLKPLCIGEKDETYILASETCALDMANSEFLDFVKPGEMITISEKKPERERLSERPCHHCIFENVYYSNGPSNNELGSVRGFRINSGRLSVKTYEPRCEMFFPIPDSGRDFCIGCSYESGLPLTEALIKNRGSKKTFQIPNPELRNLATATKFLPAVGSLNNRILDGCDDSIVKGGISRGVNKSIKKLKLSGYNERTSFAPMPFHCINNLYNQGTLIAQDLENLSIEEINDIVGKKIGINELNGELYYQTPANVLKAIENGKEKVCMACVTGNYPINKKFLPENYLDKNVRCVA